MLLNKHWSNSNTNVATPTVVDRHGETRIYLDCYVEAFDDVLRYIEYVVEFLKDICMEGKSGLRLHRLQNECDFFTVASFIHDVESILPREDVSFSVCDYAIKAWCWKNCAGNEEALL